MNKETTDQVKAPNPTGKGGFQDHPENRNPGGWQKTETFRYWYDVFKEMTVSELKEWQLNNSENIRSVASDLAFTRIIKSKDNLKEFKEVANRSEGMPDQTTKLLGSDKEPLELIIKDYRGINVDKSQ